MDEWRRQLTNVNVQPGGTRAGPQRYGCTRLLDQLTRAKMELKRVGKLKEKVELELQGVGERCAVLQKWYDGQEAMDLRGMQHLLHLKKMKVKGEKLKSDEAVAEVRLLWAVNVSNSELHEADRKRWEAQMKDLAAKIDR